MNSLVMFTDWNPIIRDADALPQSVVEAETSNLFKASLPGATY